MHSMRDLYLKDFHKVSRECDFNMIQYSSQKIKE